MSDSLFVNADIIVQCLVNKSSLSVSLSVSQSPDFKWKRVLFHGSQSKHRSSSLLQFITNPVVGDIVNPNEGALSQAHSL